MENVKKSTIDAYSDCNGLSQAQRNLDYMASEAVNIDDLFFIMDLAVPDGYNDFDAKTSIAQLKTVFGDKAEYIPAREGSVCIYVRPKNNLWLAKLKDIRADEVSFDGEKQIFRIWWD